MTQNKELPLLKSARREAFTAMSIWIIATIYSVGYCSLFGYGRSEETLKFVFGFPDWVFWGIVVPWGVCTIVATLFAFLFMADEDLDSGGAPITTPISDSQK